MNKLFNTFVILVMIGCYGYGTPQQDEYYDYEIPQTEYIELNHRAIDGDLSYILDRESSPSQPLPPIRSRDQLQELILTPAYNQDSHFNPFSFVEDIFKYYDEDFFENYYIIFFPSVGDRRFISFRGVTTDGDIKFNTFRSEDGYAVTCDFQSFMLILEMPVD